MGASSSTPATGTVSFYFSGSSTPFASAVLLVNGVAAAQYTFTTAGVYSITAVYTGDTNYATSSGSLAQFVGDFSFTIGATSSATLRGLLLGFKSRTVASVSAIFQASPRLGQLNSVALSCSTVGGSQWMI